MLLLLTVVCIIPLIMGFNIDTKHVHIFNDSSNNTADSYFGYSVVLQQDQSSSVETLSWLLVGAPRQKSSDDGTDYPGAVFQCPLAPTGACKIHTMDLNVFTDPKDYFTENRTSAWFGGAIDALDKGNLTLGCASRWIAIRIKSNAQRNQINGICYLYESKHEFVSPLFNLSQLETGSNGAIKFINIFGQAGFATHFVQGNAELLLGAPGVMNWRGNMIQYKIKDREFIVPTPLEETDETSYLGYSIGSGKFFNKSITSYVSGAPRAGYKGKVYLFQFPNETNGRIDILQVLEGGQMGEYFGMSLCVVDFNGDGMDDLLVGAPRHSLNGSDGDEGCVYEYINNNEKGILRRIKNLCGPKSKSQFGFTLALLGDINKDGFPDIAIGAPYEQKGTLYIYHGTKDGLEREYSQRITAEMISPNLRGFGASISRGLDVDGNFYNDFAVGAYTSGHAVVLYTSPIVNLNARLTSSEKGVSASTETFNITACLLYKGKDVPQTIGVDVNITLDERFIASESTEYFENLTVNTQTCKTFPGTFRVSRDLEHLHFLMAYQLNETSKQIKYNGKFCKDCTIVNPKKKTSKSLMIPFITGCNNGSNCLIDLKVQAQLKDIESPFMLGSKEELTLSINVSNTAEPSFETVLTVKLPAQPPLLRLPKNCKDQSQLDTSYILLECTLGLLHKNTKRELKIDLNLRDFFDDPLEMKFNMSVKGVGTEVNPKDNEYILKLQTVSRTEIIIEGITTKEQIVFDDNNLIDNVFNHTFKVTNKGPSPSKNIRMEFFIPVGIKIGHQFVEVYKPEEHLSKDSQLCKKISGPKFETSQRNNSKTSPVLDKSSLSSVQSFEMTNTSTAYEESLMSTVLPFIAHEEPTESRPSKVDERCQLPWTSCITVECNSLSLRKDESVSVSFSMRTSRNHLETSSEDHKLVFNTTGLAELNHPPGSRLRNVSVTTVSTTFILNQLGDATAVATVFIIGAVGGGLLLLLLIILILLKCGFFKRKNLQQHQGKKVRRES